MSDRERRLRDLAYLIWEENGRPEGEEERHWSEAERRDAAEHAASVAPKPAKAGKAAGNVVAKATKAAKTASAEAAEAAVDKARTSPGKAEARKPAAEGHIAALNAGTSPEAAKQKDAAGPKR